RRLPSPAECPDKSKQKKVKMLLSSWLSPFINILCQSIPSEKTAQYFMVWFIVARMGGGCQDLFSLLFEVFLIFSTMYSILLKQWPNRKKTNPIA
ncbi:MAG: hypothetical protein ACYSOD_07740, partial [Planctomycetota bacterium]